MLQGLQEAKWAIMAKIMRKCKPWRCVSYHHLGSISLLPFALAADRGNGDVNGVANEVIDERTSGHGPGVFCVRVCVF